MYTPIKLDKIRNLRYGMAALSLIEESFKTKVSKFDFDGLSMKEIATFIWAGLVHEDKELTPDKVMELIDEHSGVQQAIETMTKAFSKSFSGHNKKNVQRAAMEVGTEAKKSSP
jgi:hypothetical protein